MRFVLLATGPQGLGKRGGQLRHQLGVLLSGELQAQLEVVAVPSYAELLEAIGRGTVSMAWLPPAVFVEARDHFGVRLIGRAVRHGHTRYRGALYVPRGSPRRTLDDLRGASVAWVDRYSCAGHLFPRLALADRVGAVDGWLGRQQFLASHAGVARAVEAGDAEVGAGYLHVAEEDGGRVLDAGWSRVAGAEAMRALLISDVIPSDTICAAPNADSELCDAAADVLYRVHETPEGQSALQGLLQAVAIEPGDPEEYATVRRAMRKPAL